MRRLAGAGLAVAALALSACGSSSSGNGGSTPPSVSGGSTAPATTNANGCTKAPAITATPQTNKYPTAPPLTIQKTTYTAKIVTNCGTIVVSMDGKDAPQTVNSFNFLASKGYFNDTPCHRLTEPKSGISILQCGDPTGTGEGGPGYTIPDENLKGAKYTAGTVAMANTGQPHTGGSQFFLIYGPTQLRAQYTPFGTVTSGLNILKNIAKAGVTPVGGQDVDGSPKQPVVIESFTVTKG